MGMAAGLFGPEIKGADVLLEASDKASKVWAVATLDDVQAGIDKLAYPKERFHYAKGMVEEVRRHFKENVFRTIIPRSVRLSEAPSHGLPVSLYAPNSAGSVAYRLLAAELLNGDRMPENSL